MSENDIEDHDRPRHPIRIVARRTGVNPTLLRAWERRYGVVDPARSEGGQRLYSDADVERLLLLRRVTDAGRSIGNVAEMENADLEGLLREDEAARVAAAEDASGPSTPARGVSDAFDAVQELDPVRLETVLQREILALGGERFLDELVGPLLVKVGEEWRSGSIRPAHEHVAVAVVKQTLGSMMERARIDGDGPTIVVGTLSGEEHEVGALLAATAAALEGWRVIFMGEDLPPEEIALTAGKVGASAVGISVISPSDWDAVPGALRELAGLMPDGVPVILGGAAAPDMARIVADVRVRAVQTLSDFRETLRTID